MLPQTLSGLSRLRYFSYYNNPGLCAPIDDAFQNWLEDISFVYGSSCALADSQEDRAVLVQVHSATDGDNWTNNDNWLGDDLVREWHGVATDADGRVNGLTLPQNQLKGEIPAELGSLTQLRRLSLRTNQLRGEIPGELGRLANLQVLYLQNNQLTGEIPTELGNLTNLTSLFLQGNQLTGCIPAALKRVPSNDYTELELPFCTVAHRSFSPVPVVPGGQVTVTISADNYGSGGGVTETLPAGFTYVSSSLPDIQVTVTGQTIKFALFGEMSFTYSVTAPNEVGSYAFSGTLRDFDQNDHEVGGDSTVTVAVTDPLIVRYDANNNWKIDRNEVVNAINDYLFGDGEITRADVVRLINLYLFG